MWHVLINSSATIFPFDKTQSEELNSNLKFSSEALSLLQKPAKNMTVIFFSVQLLKFEIEYVRARAQGAKLLFCGRR